MAGPWETVGDAVGDVVGGAARAVGAVAGLFDIGEPEGNDHGSSHWPGWGHDEIRSMLDTTVDPGDVHEGARAWGEQREWAVDIVARLTDDLRSTVFDGWRGGSADAAIASLEPFDRWSANQSDAAEHTARLLDDSGSAAGQAKATVPPPIHHDWRQSLSTFNLGGVGPVFVDAVAQDQAQEEARREAVHIMTRMYSAPIKDYRAAVPFYPQLVDPTLRPADPSPLGGPTPGAGLPSGGSGVSDGATPGGSVPYQPPVAAGLQGAGSVEGGQFGPPAGPPQPGGQGYGGYPGHGGQGQGQGVGAAAAAAVPFMPPMAGGDEQERARRGFRGAGPPGGRAGGAGGHLGGGRGGGVSGYPGGDFGPRGSNPAPAAAAGEGRVGAGGAAGGRGGGGMPGGVPVGGPGGRGQGAEDTEHRRPSFLIEMNDIFNDGRKVAPPVIGVDLPEDHR